MKSGFGIAALVWLSFALAGPVIAETTQRSALLHLAASASQSCRASCIVGHEDCVADIKSSASKGKWPALLPGCDAKMATCKAKCPR